MEQLQTGRRPRRSVKLTTEEKTAYKKKIASFPTKYDAALFFGMSQVTLHNILTKGSGREDCIIRIREKIGTAA